MIQTPYGLSYMWNLKKTQKQKTELKEQTGDCQRWGRLGVCVCVEKWVKGVQKVKINEILKSKEKNQNKKYALLQTPICQGGINVLLQTYGNENQVSCYIS